MAPLFEASKRVVLTSPSLSLPELLRCLGLGVSKVERAEQILSELRKQGYLEVGGNSWWKAEVLAVMMSGGSIIVLHSTLFFFINVPHRLPRWRDGPHPDPKGPGQREPHDIQSPRRKKRRGSQAQICELWKPTEVTLRIALRAHGSNPKRCRS